MLYNYSLGHVGYLHFLLFFLGPNPSWVHQTGILLLDPAFIFFRKRTNGSSPPLHWGSGLCQVCTGRSPTDIVQSTCIDMQKYKQSQLTTVYEIYCNDDNIHRCTQTHTLK